MTTVKRRAAALGGLVGLAIVVAFAGHQAGMQMAGHPECPHTWDSLIASYNDTVLTPGQLSLPGRITNIPEFHDCQEFVVDRRWGFVPRAGRVARSHEGAVWYQGMYAVFSSFNAERRWSRFRELSAPTHLRPAPVRSVENIMASPDTNLVSRAVVPEAAGSGSAMAFVEVYAEGRYVPLGIEAGFNCGYVFSAGGGRYQAFMVNYYSKEHDCGQPQRLSTLVGTVLDVHRSVHRMHRGHGDPGHGGDYPPNSRWERDPVNNIEIVGFGCGDAWCEMGPANFVSPPPRMLPLAGGLPNRLHRVYHVEGWFDEQQLALPGPVPSAVTGLVFPDPGLDRRRSESDFGPPWKPAARVAISADNVTYRTKLNLMPTTSLTESALNLVELCFGTWQACTGLTGGPDPAVSAPCATPDPYGEELPADHGMWWARITPPDGSPQYRCVRRRDHSSVTPIARGTARWRWLRNDETIWMYCAAGCCEVELM